MKINNSEPDLAKSKIEFEENKILLLIKKFWEFSNFYGEYRASIHFKSNQAKQKSKNRNSQKNPDLN